MSDNKVTNPTQYSDNPSLTDLCEKRYSRRAFVKTGVALGVAAATLQLTGCGDPEETRLATAKVDDEWRNKSPYRSKFDFIEIEHGIDENHHVAPDHTADVLLRWGDPIFKDAPEFDVDNQSAASQSKQFGYNNDYIGYLSLKPGRGQEARALLCVNHEYPIHGLMFPDFGLDLRASLTEEQAKVSMASIGASIVEVALQDGQWQVIRNSRFNRRITALDTEMEVTGPAAGHPRMRTSADGKGRKVIGTFNNCAGGMTPWGTYLTCEENFNYHFTGKSPTNHPEAENHRRYNVPTDLFHWGKFDKRFDVGAEPNEPNRFGWVVEIDPLDPTSTPKKRTALGRFKHEGGENVIAPDGRLVVYMGDDQRFEYVYKFVSRDPVDLENPRKNRDLLDHGTLYVAKFYEDGFLEWLPLTHDNGPLQTQFESQADILIEPRRAADLLNATPMDRPEDIIPNADTGRVYVNLTNNTKRTEGNVANPRPANVFGHVIEISEMDSDFAGTRAYWDILVKCGDPENPGHDAQWNPKTSEHGWFASPDNGVIDPSGRLWIATDQSDKTGLSGTADGLWALETSGPLRGTGRMFFRVPEGAEMCGPIFSDDGESLFLAVQHPGDQKRPGAARIKSATTTWPDFTEGKPPRPSVVVVRKTNGGKVG